MIRLKKAPSTPLARMKSVRTLFPKTVNSHKYPSIPPKSRHINPCKGRRRQSCSPSLQMQVVDHIPPHNFSAWPSRSSPRHPTESTPLLTGSSCNPLHPKAHSTRVGWNNAAQNRIRGKAHSTKRRKKPSTIRSLSSPEWLMDLERSHDHRHSNSGQVSPHPQGISNPRYPSPVAIDDLDDIHPGPTDTKPSPADTLPPSSSDHSQTVSLCLQNSGSVARDHLASERTFLAYVRTSLAIVSAGVGEC